MFNYIQVEVIRSEVTVFNVSVAPWELPLLEGVNGKDVVKVVGSVPVRRAIPDAVTEYERLSAKYGTDKENSGQEFVALVYGGGSVGISRLAEEIAKVTETHEATDSAPAGDAEPTSEDELRALGLLPDAPKMAEGARAISE